MAEGNGLRVRPMSPADIDFAVERIREAGWASQSREVFAAFLDHDPRGCFVAEAGSERVGICVATRYRANAFIGELVVKRDRRILGAGRVLLARALAYLDGQGIRDVFLDGDLNAVPYYESVGFRKIRRSLRFRGRIRGKTHSDVRPLRPADLDGICARDLDFFGDDRSFFLRRFAGLHPELGFVRENSRRHLRLHHGQARAGAAGGRALGGLAARERLGAPAGAPGGGERRRGFPHRRHGKQPEGGGPGPYIPRPRGNPLLLVHGPGRIPAPGQPPGVICHRLRRQGLNGATAKRNEQIHLP